MKTTATTPFVTALLTVLVLLGLTLAIPAQAQVVTLGKTSPLGDQLDQGPLKTLDKFGCFCSGLYTELELRNVRTTNLTNVYVRFNGLTGTPKESLGTITPGTVFTIDPPGTNTNLGNSIQLFQGDPDAGGTSLGTLVTDCATAPAINLGKVNAFTGIIVASISDSSAGAQPVCRLTSDPELDITSTGPGGSPPPFDPGDQVTFTVTVCNHRDDGAGSTTCDGSGSSWPFGVDADGVTVDIRVNGTRLDLDESSVSTTCTGGCSTVNVDTSNPDKILVTIPFEPGGTNSLGETVGGGSAAKLTITFTATVLAGPTESIFRAVIAEVTSAFPKDIQGTSGNCPLDTFGTPAEDDCDRVSFGLTPVELTDLRAGVDGRDVTLAWETASELNNAGFEIQHRSASAPNAEFETIGWADGHGTTNEPQRYEFRVEDLDPGQHVFRLRQLDYDGAFEYSPLLEVSVEMPDSYVLSEVYPNPFNPQASFSFGVHQAQLVQIDLYNVLGQHVQSIYRGRPSAGTTQVFSIDGSGLQSGTYLLRVVGEQFVDSQTVTLIK